MSVCLDSWAILAWLDGDEPAASRVSAELDSHPHMSWINLCEVYYRVTRDHGREEADKVLSELRPLLTLDLPGTTMMVSAARIKAAQTIALADCFALATAAAHGATLMTGDPEIVEAVDLPCPVEDLREK